MVIDSDGTKHGIMSKKEAIELAQNASLDLVQVSPNDAEPVVCKILDYGKYIFDKKKASRNLKIKQREPLSKKLNLDHRQILVTIILN